MASKPRELELPGTLPDVRCPAGSAPRAPHEWAPLHTGGFYCTACLSELMPPDIDDWRLLLQIEEQRGDAALSGDAYAMLSEMVADTVMLSHSECRVLQRLGAEPKYVVRHEELANSLWGGASAAAHDKAALRQHVTALRRKLAQLRIGVGAVPGVGYRLTIKRERASGSPERR